MTPVELRAIGEAIYGERWQSALARALGFDSARIRAMLRGDRPISDGLAAEIEAVAARHRAHEALDLIGELAREHGGMPAIALARGRDAVGRRATRLLAEALRELGVAVEITAE